MSARTIDRLSEIAILVGITLAGVGVYLALGVPALLGYVGAVLIVGGVVLALAAPATTRRERNP